MKSAARVSTGLKGLDEIIDDLRVGDNVVWRVDDIADYKYLVDFYVGKALEDNHKVVYMRFADHAPLIEKQHNVIIYYLDAQSGFESFSTQVHQIVTREGEGVYYVFDCLSDLLSAWANDLMIGNFFLITCPYLFELETVAYFSIIRDRHSFQTVARIRDITQVLIDVHNYKDGFNVHPLKVWQRYSPTMFLPHVKEGQRFTPIASSLDTTKLFYPLFEKQSKQSKRNLDYWNRLFLEAEDLLSDQSDPEKRQKIVDQLCRIMITRDPKMLALVKENFSLEDLLNIYRRLIGTGFIGGKAAGMLLARKILMKDQNIDWQKLLEPHDSFYVGADVYYTYLIQNGLWKLRMKQKTKEGYFEAAGILKDKMEKGIFPDEIKEQLLQLIEYFGQSPIIVRSSSLLEDSFGDAFAGKYKTIFLVNQGPPEQRYAQLEDSIRKIYASTMNEDALTYRLQRGLGQADEQMALLIQRVSGLHRNYYFFPDAAGVGVSQNTFIWKKDMDPKAGMLRLVLGLGTRAVNRVEGDYPRMVALDAPSRKPHGGIEDTRRFSQHDVDVLNIKENRLETVSITELMSAEPGIKMDYIGIKDHETNRKMRELGIKGKEAWIVTFDKLLSTTSFAEIMDKLLKKLETIYSYPVDTEFTVNFTKEGQFHINLLQCRPLQTIGLGKKVKFPENVEKNRILFEFEGNFFGGSISQPIRRIIYVDPQQYIQMPLSKKYDVARLIGKLNRQIVNKEELPTMLLGPGRWGSTTPSLGVPVSFSEINQITVLGEIAYVSGDLMPELSFGTHFFNDLVETKIFYVAIFPGEKDVYYNLKELNRLPNILTELIPSYSSYKDVVQVYDAQGENFKIIADIISQKVLCFR
ncbi:MAG: PEP/pyruvate-binding domain-containing protein [Desulfobacterales bacterium]|nr:PEP/pyruvate-binding domain-containing protein [Desulfobacterales bacterium]